MTELLHRGRPDPRSDAMISTGMEGRVAVDATRSSPMDWMRARRAERESRRAEQQHNRLAQRMGTLGEDWRVLDLKEATGTDRDSVLAVGPGGVFAVTVKDHGRSRVQFAGDIVQIDGRRPKYVEEARENAKLAAEALSRTAGVSILVMPVLAFAGTGKISYYGMPKRCLVTSYQDISRVLHARGQRLAPDTVDKVFALAVHPATWMNPPYHALAERYRWYPEELKATGGTGADKRSSSR
jgi:hypothetical protein